MFRIENGLVYAQETGEGYSVWEPHCPEYRISTVTGAKTWERFDIEAGVYIPAPEYSEPFPEEPVPLPSAEIRIMKLEAENAELKAVLDDMIINSPIPAMQVAIDELILNGGAL